MKVQGEKLILKMSYSYYMTYIRKKTEHDKGICYERHFKVFKHHIRYYRDSLQHHKSKYLFFSFSYAIIVCLYRFLWSIPSLEKVSVPFRAFPIHRADFNSYRVRNNWEKSVLSNIVLFLINNNRFVKTFSSVWIICRWKPVFKGKQFKKFIFPTFLLWKVKGFKITHYC